ncbi:MAG: hypothetical protein Q7J68_07710 [Thermoplasmata archaeon]|nr:hypothetical protein [Thermoplasmata archaeon]
MIIPLQIVRKTDKNEKEHVFCSVTALLSCRKPHFFQGNIQLMVDTGATMECCVTDNDAEIMNLSFGGRGVTKLPEDQQPKAWSGSLETYTIKNVAIRCRGKEGKKDVLFSSEIEECHIAKGVPKGLPSVLGTRFLISNNLKLVFSPNDDVAYLEQI